MIARATQIGHVGSIVYAHSHFALFEMMRRDRVATGRHSETLVELARVHQMPMFSGFGAAMAVMVALRIWIIHVPAWAICAPGSRPAANEASALMCRCS